MKRCPQCLFIYPESDTRCDFDNTLLVTADEAEIEAATSQAATPSKSKKRKAPARTAAKTRRTKSNKLITFTVILAFALGLISLIAYYGMVQRRDAQIAALVEMPPQPIALPSRTTPIVSPSPIATPSPSPSTSAIVKPATERVATSHSNTTVAPVSTSGPGIGKRLGGKPSILLTSGGKIDADEVWRTRDGVWYRRDGIVTLLKHGRVKAIVNQ